MRKKVQKKILMKLGFEKSEPKSLKTMIPQHLIMLWHYDIFHEIQETYEKLFYIPFGCTCPH